jgi:dihydropteroate synthase
MLEDGATIIDLGGQSTRPGSQRISPEEEMARVIQPVSEIAKRFPEAVISIDTFYGKVVTEAVEAGAHIVNDISAGSIDPAMIPAVAQLKVPYVLMHMQGEPQTMQADPEYTDVTRDVLDFFIQKMNQLKKAGINDIIIDPGFGFGKTRSHNLQLLKNLSAFHMLDAPILIGLSRKSMISKILGVDTSGSLNGTTVLNTIGLLNGATILRVHDVKEAQQAITLFTEYNQSGKIQS